MESVQIQILGQTYSIKAQDDPVYVRELSAFLDAKMREVQTGTGTVDPHRVAILTALMITDELFRIKKQYGVLERLTDSAARRLIELTESIP